MEFNKTKNDAPTRTTNYEGGVAYEPASPEMGLYQVTANNLLENTFYRDDEEALMEVDAWFSKAADADAAFPMQLAAHAQQDLGLRDISNLLAVLSSNDERTREYVEPFATDVFVRPDDVTTAVAMHDAIFDRPLPQSIRRAINDALHQWDAHQFAKYDTDRREVNLRDVVNRTHPKPRDDEREEVFRRLIRGPMDAHEDVEPLDTPETWETILTEMGNTREAWERALPRMGLFAKIRNVRNMLEAGLDGEDIFGDEDMDHVRNSMFMPFRFYRSYRAYEEGATGLGSLYGRDETVESFLSNAIDITAENVPDEFGKTLVAVDVSGSMDSRLSPDSETTYMDISAFFGGVLSQQGADTIAFGTDAKHVSWHHDAPTLERVEDMQTVGGDVGGGTNAYKVFDQHLNIPDRMQLPEAREFDRVVFLTDGQVWDNTRMGGGREFREAWRDYAEASEADPSLYIMDLASYSDLTVPENAENVFRVKGWTSRIIDFMVNAERPGQAIEEIRENYPVE